MVPTILKQNKRVDKIKGKSSIKDNVIVKFKSRKCDDER